jgi:hypothetical protein
MKVYDTLTKLLQIGKLCLKQQSIKIQILKLKHKQNQVCYFNAITFIIVYSRTQPLNNSNHIILFLIWSKTFSYRNLQNLCHSKEHLILYNFCQ